MGLRDELIGIVDDVRRDVIDADLELRRYTVTVRVRAWTGGEIGLGIPIDIDTELTPRPKVSDTPPRWAHAEPGRWEAGDRTVTRISAAYTEADLGAFGPERGTEVLWLLDNGQSVDEYALQGQPEIRYLEWRVHLRRRKGRARERR